ncbi:thioesterase family protein [Sphingomonas sp. C3-2]|uniref:acyl-CoA thioesterase n=1 Tax=Sphingomonas sp. C3-2 TaxID=3062169 RepID=UPI00294B5224|nr:thioesterase family protein [Sphingomonas sp. C3-2]WOK38023.1 thioesterase family protein [Sphingomonas sp. C3-2]
MTSLFQILAVVERHPDGFAFDIPANWMQGRTAYGGLSSALALHSAHAVAPDLPALRTAQISFVGPLAGRATARSQLLRRGRTAAFIRTDIYGEAGLALSATFVFMDALASHIDHVDLPAPSVFPESVAAHVPREAPEFTRNFDHFDAGTDRASADLIRWTRLKERDGVDPMTALIAIGDALPPGALCLAHERGPISSMTWLINLLTPAPATTDGWWLLRSRADYARNGCSSQVMTIWNRDGTPVATGMQSVALFI